MTGAPLALLLDRWPAGQATFAAIFAVSQLAVSQKNAATWIAAASRGAVQGSAAVCGEPDSCFPIVAQEMALHVLQVKKLPQALELLRRNGGDSLANRLARQSKARNSAAHPDVSLLTDLEAFWASAQSWSDGDTSSHETAGVEHFDIASCEDDNIASDVAVPISTVITKPRTLRVQVSDAADEGAPCTHAGSDAFDNEVYDMSTQFQTAPEQVAEKDSNAPPSYSGARHTNGGDSQVPHPSDWFNTHSGGARSHTLWADLTPSDTGGESSSGAHESSSDSRMRRLPRSSSVRCPSVRRASLEPSPLHSRIASSCGIQNRVWAFIKLTTTAYAHGSHWQNPLLPLLIAALAIQIQSFTPPWQRRTPPRASRPPRTT